MLFEQMKRDKKSLDDLKAVSIGIETEVLKEYIEEANNKVFVFI